MVRVLGIDLEKNQKKFRNRRKNKTKKREQALIGLDFQYFAYSPKVVYFAVFIALLLRFLRKFNTKQNNCSLCNVTFRVYNVNILCMTRTHVVRLRKKGVPK